MVVGFSTTKKAGNMSRTVKAVCRFCGRKVTYFGNICAECAESHPEFDPEEIG